MTTTVETHSAPLPKAVMSVSNLIGHTPLIRMDRFFGNVPFEVYGKLEKMNPGGSIKDRAARSILQNAIRRGEVIPGRTTVIESSSGNLGIAMAMLCQEFGVDFICVTDAKATPTNIRLIEAFGATLDIITVPDPRTGEFLPMRLKRVKELLDSVPDSWWSNQYGNPDNPAAHEQTVREILEDIPHVDVLVCATGSCGTLRGCHEALRSMSPHTRLIAVDAQGSAIFDEAGTPHPRYVPGHGASVRPPLWRAGLADQLVLVSDADCVMGCREALRTESLLLGGSSGAILTAIHRAAPTIPTGSTVVAILPDGGERYLDTIYDQSWVTSHVPNPLTPAEWRSAEPDHMYYLNRNPS
ncbi:2,3-diaminopropionate biosynthesis protein SbnA [Cutibacterium sp. WCA-380-WT-3A]|uniref:N-(2-amino-2-carboxyethyl)-L-glutamate synthase n=1 Tax=Cutibacterium porci TaxID=2605781 RepID=A0A7K0J3U7_9ACTN|nr:2,3-diaminopropionate biosynthesis protein SbnA [Cutibacterium porci]MSS44611.1 2,3-diaminopropionate biosynthesis protein SbnA [Cutibacterium porci]